MGSGVEDAIRERLGGRYEFLGALGKRGHASLHKVRERPGGSLRALEIITSEAPGVAELLARFRRQAELAGEIRHHNIARVHRFEDLGDGAGYLETELVDGRRLDELLAAATLPSIGLSVEIGRQALAALAALHRRRLAHCDVSAENLVLTRDEEDEPQVKLLGLGVVTETGQVPAQGYPGRPDHAPPEHLEPQPRPVEPADDLYALAVVLYELTTGKHPFPGRVGTVAAGGEGRQAPLEFARTDPGGRVPTGLRKILLRALAEEPSERYASAIELSDALAQVGAEHRYSDRELEELLTAMAAEPEKQTREKTATLELEVVREPEPEPPEPVAPVVEPPPPPTPWQPPERRRWWRRAWLWWLTAAAAAAVAGVFYWLPEPGVKHTLTLQLDGAGSGRVTSDPRGIDCGDDCRHAFDEGSQVRLAAIADAGSRFAGWSIDLSDDTLTLTADLSLTATFEAVPDHIVSVVKEGGGAGRVTSDPPGIDCGADCEGRFPAGSSVRLTATPDPGSDFRGWDPPLPDGPVEIVSDLAYTATFEPAPPGTYSLTVEKTGGGSGRVASTPAGIDCGPRCRQTFGEGTAVSLTATADPGSVFAGWSPAIDDGTVTLAADRTVTATFRPAPEHALVVSKLGSGSGRVTSSPAGIDCGDVCEGRFSQGSPVRLRVTPDEGSSFAGWSPDLEDDTVSLTANLELIATFRARVATYTLTIERSGSGSGQVTSSPGGIDCGKSCRKAFEKGTAVRLTAVADPGSEFQGWGKNVVEDKVVLNADRTVTATFEAATRVFTLTVERSGAGSGRVTSSPAGIDCGDDCEESFPQDAVVQLTAEPERGSFFDGWSPALVDGAVTLTADRTYRASFEPAPDEKPPVITLIGSDYGKKKKDAYISFHIRDDEEVVERIAYVRQGQAGSPRTFSLEEDEDRQNVFHVVVPAYFHQGEEIYYWVTAEDSSGNVGTLASRDKPNRVERKGWWERGENWLQGSWDKLRGKK